MPVRAHRVCFPMTRDAQEQGWKKPREGEWSWPCRRDGHSLSVSLSRLFLLLPELGGDSVKDLSA